MKNLKGNWASQEGHILRIKEQNYHTFSGTLNLGESKDLDFHGIYDEAGKVGLVATQLINLKQSPIGIRGQLVNKNGVVRLELDIKSKEQGINRSLAFYEESLIPTTLLDQ